MNTLEIAAYIVSAFVLLAVGRRVVMAFLVWKSIKDGEI